MQATSPSWRFVVVGAVLALLIFVAERPASVRAAGAKPSAPKPVAGKPAAGKPTTAPRATLCAIVTDATPHLRELLPAVRAHVTREVRASWVHDDVVEREMRRRPLHEMHPLTAGPKRAAAGTAMLADLLVILRAGVGKERSVEVTVAEPVHGLTLVRETVVLGAEKDQSAADVAAPIMSGIELQQTGLREIWTVLPFANTDASAEQEHLEAALPELVKVILRRRPGAIVVEPAEADAVAAELRGGRVLRGAAAQARLPLYFTGAFRAPGGTRIRVPAAPDGPALAERPEPARPGPVRPQPPRPAGRKPRGLFEDDPPPAEPARPPAQQPAQPPVQLPARPSADRPQPPPTAPPGAGPGAKGGRLAKLSLDLVVHRGARVTARGSQKLMVKDVEAKAVAAAVTDAAGKLAAQVAGGKPSPALPVDRQVELLARRGNAARAANDWPPAAALIEAALLLRPGDPALHAQAAEAVFGLSAWTYRHGGESAPAMTAAAFRLYERGLRHFEVFLWEGKVADDRRELLWSYHNGPNGLHVHPKAAPWLRDEKPRLQRARHDMALRVLRGRVAERRDGRDDHDRRAIEWSTILASGEIEHEAVDATYVRLGEVLDLVTGHPDAPKLVNRVLRRGYTVGRWESPQFRAFLKRVTALPNEEIASVAKKVEEELDRRAGGGAPGGMARGGVAGGIDDAARPPATRPADPGPVAGPVSGPTDVSFQLLDLKSDEAGPDGVTHVAGIMPAGKGVDFAWGSRRLYLMTRKGRLRTIWQTDQTNMRFEEPRYDGRYVWVPASSSDKPPLLLVVNPADGRVAEITAADGLPLRGKVERGFGDGTHSLHVAPLGPGKACVAGFTGWSWLAIVNYSPKDTSVRMFHEARRLPDMRDKEDKGSDLIFRVGWMVTLTKEPFADADSSAERRVILGRAQCPSPMLNHPLIIDPQKMTVEVMEGQGPWGEARHLPSGLHGGTLYWLRPGRGRTPAKPRPDVWKMSFPDFQKASVAEVVHDGEGASFTDKLFFHDGRVFIQSRKLWVADAPDKPFRELRGDTPDRLDMRAVIERKVQVKDLPDEQTESIEQVMHSEHYGLLVKTRQNKSGHRLYHVRFSGGPPAKGDDAKPQKPAGRGGLFD